MKIIFLDVDGVLNSTRSILTRTGPHWTTASRMAYDELSSIHQHELDADELLPYGPAETIKTVDPVAVDLINRLIQKSDAEIVLSTSHRSFFLPKDGFGGEKHTHCSSTSKLSVSRRKFLASHRKCMSSEVLK